MSEPPADGKNSSRGTVSPGAPDPGLPWEERRTQLRSWVEEEPVPHVPREEVDAHFKSMPAHYWQNASLADVIWGIQSVHAFFDIISKSDVPATTPFLDWRTSPDSKLTRAMLCTWDRHGLFAKASATFSALNISIAQADVYTRVDNVALDVFHVSRAKGLKPIDEQIQQEVGFLLAGALSEPPRFASVWAYSRHKYLARPGAAAPPQISFDTDSDPESTILSVRVGDRLGLLYDLLQALADLGLNIRQARIKTDAHLAMDQFSFTDTAGKPVSAPKRLAEIRRRLEAVLI